MMKKLFALILALLLLVSLSACNGTKKGNEPITDANGNVLPSNLPEGAVTAMREKFDTFEYTQYINIFYQDMGSQFEGSMTKDGNFAVLQDEFNGVTRYYVWGYNDKTRCCDYQWEFVPNDVSALPAPGSYIKVTGVFTANDAALDGYWMEDADVTVVENYTPAAVDYDLTTMSPTLARVQIINMVRNANVFDGKTLLVYGRVKGMSTLQHPYYNDSWEIDMQSETAYSPDTYLLVTGAFMAEGSGCFLSVSNAKEI